MLNTICNKRIKPVEILELQNERHWYVFWYYRIQHRAGSMEHALSWKIILGQIIVCILFLGYFETVECFENRSDVVVFGVLVLESPENQ